MGANAAGHEFAVFVEPMARALRERGGGLVRSNSCHYLATEPLQLRQTAAESLHVHSLENFGATGHAGRRRHWGWDYRGIATGGLGLPGASVGDGGGGGGRGDDGRQGSYPANGSAGQVARSAAIGGFAGTLGGTARRLRRARHTRCPNRRRPDLRGWLRRLSHGRRARPKVRHLARPRGLSEPA